jgi:3-hydroxyacyl-CoA dehydrogenase
MAKIADDWIIEVGRKVRYQKLVFEQVEKYRKPGTLITSNTSEFYSLYERKEDFQKHFCGTHFLTLHVT